MEGNYILLFLVLYPMIGALIGYLIGRKSKQARNYFADVIVISEFLILLYLFVTFNESSSFVWNEFCGRGLSLKLDGFRVLYAGIAALMWMMTTIFSREYFAHYRNRNRYYFFNLLTLGATVGVCLSSDLFTTFIFFEIMSFTSYVWVVHDEKEEALRAGGTYLAVAVLGGLVMLMGLFLLYHEVGTLEISELLTACEAVSNKTPLYIAGGCILFGFGAKAGMFPLHIWLPKAHPVAPAPASALLSGILTKSGIFGILVISSEIFLHDYQWGVVILSLGTITMFMGAVLAVFSIDLKRTLACSSMSQIGFILVGVGMQGILGHHNALAVRGTLLHMINHSLIKLVLFMAAGVVFMNLHKLDLNSIRGFGRKKPLLKFSFLMGALGIGGIPLWNGYVSKTLLHESIVEFIHEGAGVNVEAFKAVEWIFLITGGLTIAYMIKLYVALFIEKNPYDQKKMDESNHRYMNKESVFALVGSAVLLPILGIFPNVTMDRLATMGQGFMHGENPAHTVHYFSFQNLKGAIISLVVGLVVYFLFIRLALMKEDEKGNRIYINAWPEWLDLEEAIYRPIFLGLVPFLCTFVSRVLEQMADGFIKLMERTVFAPTKEKPPIVGTKSTFVLGTVVDDVVIFLNKTIRRKHPKEANYVERFAYYKKEMDRTGNIITRSLSFGLLMFCIGLALTLSYLLL